MKKILSHGQDIKDLYITPWKYKRVRFSNRELDYIPYGQGMIIRRSQHTAFSLSLLPQIKMWKTRKPSEYYYKCGTYNKGLIITWFKWRIDITL